jgi:uncharacterized membrane protein
MRSLLSFEQSFTIACSTLLDTFPKLQLRFRAFIERHRRPTNKEKMMKDMWVVFVAGAILSWGAYVPVLHEGQTFLNRGSLRAFLCVGVAYFLTAVLVPLGLLFAKVEPMEFNGRGVTFATLAGILGAAGALCIILALKNGGTPIVVPPLVFAGAPIFSAFVSMSWHRPKSPPEIWFYVGLLLAAVGAGLVLRYKPS